MVKLFINKTDSNSLLSPLYLGIILVIGIAVGAEIALGITKLLKRKK